MPPPVQAGIQLYAGHLNFAWAYCINPAVISVILNSEPCDSHECRKWQSAEPRRQYIVDFRRTTSEVWTRCEYKKQLCSFFIVRTLCSFPCTVLVQTKVLPLLWGVYRYCWKMSEPHLGTSVKSNISHIYAIIPKTRQIQNPDTFISQAVWLKDCQPVLSYHVFCIIKGQEEDKEISKHCTVRDRIQFLVWMLTFCLM